MTEFISLFNVQFIIKLWSITKYIKIDNKKIILLIITNFIERENISLEANAVT